MSFKLRTAAVVAALAFALTGCGKQESLDKDDGLFEISSDQQTSTVSNAAVEELDTSDMFSSRDKNCDFDALSATSVVLSDKSVTISKDGVYILSGSISNGQIVVDADSSAKIQLVLNGVDIASESSAAIYIKQADKVFVTLAPESNNKLSNISSFVADNDTNVDGVIFSKDDLTLNGSGSLEICSVEHGIVSKDDLVITSGEYYIDAKSHAVSGKDSLRICGGDFGITAGKDGLHAENSDDGKLGFIYISSGSFNIESKGDGISASAQLQIDNGNFNITSGGSSANVVASYTNSFGMERTENTTSLNSDDTSAKGLKSSGLMKITAGEFIIDSADDSVHSNLGLKVGGGRFDIKTGDDGFHSDEGLSISGGEVIIRQSYEGLEGLTIDVSGGNIDLTATDDGLNAAGGNDQSGFGGFRGMDGFGLNRMPPDSFGSNSDSWIKISGGRLTVDAGGDGIDSNGALYVTGGETYVSGPTNNGNGALDFGGTAEISGGIFIATGSSGMSQNFSSSSTQGAIMLSVEGGKGVMVSVKDSSGKQLMSFTPLKIYSSVVLSHPEIVKGNKYTITVGDSSAEVEMNNTVYGSSGGGMGRQPGMRF